MAQDAIGLRSLFCSVAGKSVKAGAPNQPGLSLSGRAPVQRAHDDKPLQFQAARARRHLRVERQMSAWSEIIMLLNRGLDVQLP